MPIDVAELVSGIIAGVVILIIGWVTGLFRFVWRRLTNRPKSPLQIRRNPNYGGWINNSDPYDFEIAVKDKTYRVSTNVRTRWWVTTNSLDPVRLTEAYFQLQPSGEAEGERKNCLISRVLETGELGPTTKIDGTQEIEVEAILFSDLLDGDRAIIGSVVLVDQTGKEYPTETLRHYSGRAEVVK
jgi:hypothetical protein